MITVDSLRPPKTIASTMFSKTLSFSPCSAHIDKGNDDVIFFADEGGSWQVGADWANVLPVWFKILSSTAAPEEYATRILDMLTHHYSYGREKMLAVARRTATPDQRKALAEVQGA